MQAEKIIEHEPAQTSLVPQTGQPRTAVTPMEMLDRAVASGAGLETIERLMTLQERWEANQARKAFTEAFAAFKAEVPAVIRNRRVTDGPLKGRSYAELFSFVDALTPALSKNGLSASWELTKDERDWIEVTCTIEHILGHSKRVSMGGPPDTGGAKNAIQARASTVSYLERHTFKAACGVAEQGDDVDGGKVRSAGETVTQEQADNLRDLLEASGKDRSKFLQWRGVERIEDIAAPDYEACVRAISAPKAGGAK